MKKTKKQIKCPKCHARYWIKNAFEKHMKTKHPFKEHVTYIELLKYPGQWGYNYDNEKDAKEAKNHPTDFTLHMAYLSQIWKTLNFILEELRKERILK